MVYRKKEKRKEKKRQRHPLKAELACTSQWSWQPDKTAAMPLPSVKCDLQRPKHTAQGQSPGQCLHSLWAEAFPGQASASQENTPQRSAAASDLWFSSSQNLSLLPTPIAARLSQQLSPSSVSASLWHTFLFPLFYSLPSFYSFPRLSIKRSSCC